METLKVGDKIAPKMMSKIVLVYSGMPNPDTFCFTVTREREAYYVAYFEKSENQFTLEGATYSVSAVSPKEISISKV